MLVPIVRRGALLAIASVLPLVSMHVRAQESASDEADAWKFAVGAGVISNSRYPGSSERRTSAIPLLSANYGRYFIGGTPGAGVPLGLGVNVVNTSDWKFGVAAGFDLRAPRKESDDPRLQGLGDISRTSHAALFGSYTHEWLNVRGNVLTDVGGKHEGTLASIALEGSYALSPQLLVSAGPGLTWADKKYTQTFFGVDAAQSTASGLAPYAASAGLNQLTFSVGANYRIGSQWFVGARATAGSLRGDARRSPITSDTSQNTFSLFSFYRF